MKLKSKKTDIYIKPNIKDFNVVSFDEGKKIIANGKKAALASIDDLSKLLEHQTKTSKEPVHKILKDSIIIREIKFSGNNKYTRSYILGKLKFKELQRIAYSDFLNGVDNLVATNNFDSFQYQLVPTNEENTYDLYADLIETKTTTFLKLGAHYDDLYKSAALVNLTKKRLLFNNDIASLDIILGDNVRYNFDYLIDKGFYWSVGLRSRYNQFKKGISAQLLLDDVQIEGTGLNKIDVLLHDQTNQFYLETLFRKDFAFSMGAEHKRLEIKSETILNSNQDEFLFESTDYFSAYGGLRLDTYDNKYFPKKGVYFNGDLHMYLFASQFNNDFDSFSLAKAEIGYAFSVSPKLSFNLRTSGGFKFGDKSTTTLDFALGGYGNNLINNFIPFYGYDFIALTGNSFVKAYTRLDFEFAPKNHLLFAANFANVDDDLFRVGEWFTEPDYSGYGIGYGWESFFGPVQVIYSWSPEISDGNFFFSVGYWF